MLTLTFNRLVRFGVLALVPWVLSACGESPAFQREAQSPPQSAAATPEGEEISGETPVGVDSAAAAPDPGQTPPAYAPNTSAASPAPQAGDATQSSTPADYDAAADADPAALADFQGELSPYGNWYEDPAYGTVWTPSAAYVGTDFAPYVTAGHWALDDGGSWLWVSDYSWGWGPFHYGRWVWIGSRGWSWIPGRVYAPAWVVWRTGYYGDYYLGWAPMPPSWYWHGGLAVRVGVIPPAAYVFCASTHVFHPSVHAHILPAARVAAIAPYTRPYVPAVAATPAVGGVTRAAAIPRGPSMAAAHVPVTAVPAQRAAAPARAMAYARTAPSVRSSAMSPAPMRSPAVAAPAPMRSPAMAAPAPMRSPAMAAPAPMRSPASAAPAPTLPAYPRSTTAPAMPSPGAPRPYVASPAPHSMAPSIAPHPASPSMPHVGPSAPHVSSPHFSTPHFSSPAPRMGGGGHFRR